MNVFPVLKGDLKIFHICKLEKSNKKSFNSNFEAVEYVGEIVHSDLVGPMTISTDGTKYACTFTYQYSRFSHIFGINSKGDFIEETMGYKALSHTKSISRGISSVCTPIEELNMKDLVY